MKCKRCGLLIQPDHTSFDHLVCDEFYQEETWLSDEDRKAKAERIRAFEANRYPKRPDITQILADISRNALRRGKL